MSDYSDFSLSFTRGDTHLFRFTVTDKLTGVVQNITTWQKFWVTGKLHLSDSDANAVFELTLGSGITILSAVQGLVQVMISPVNTASLDFRKYTLFGDIQGKDASGNIWTLAKGTFVITSDVTQATS
jgi:hypothetical protein